MRRFRWMLLFFIYVLPSHADQFQLPNYREAQTIFWKQLYPSTNYTLYCGESFSAKNDNLGIESVYPKKWVVDFLGCESIELCRAKSARFNRIEADLHNLYPALNMIRRARKNYKFSIIPGEFREFFECDFEQDVRSQVVEPREIARGNIARAIFYMHWEYGLPIDLDMLVMLKSWNLEDPPSRDEKRRNDVIEKIQGTRNEFIDQPSRANELVQLTES